ncbi:hypothetical protein BCR35DRAFT_348970 [Leucosporidium creatinivorum]|uniref:F-box domain-containing protein n=1 Tax=Leucosporidium creatinivorum TaxID=106004 RepID=A0A1Y2G3U8_9BASI|nr:hypothetical protein BCR35DRAFT_348970 [Leucosporidium creatinivorum]
MDNPLEARSPPSPPPAEVDDEAPRQLPSLPTEILQKIIQLSLPRLSFKTFRERYSILLVLCRVNKLWAAIAQKELGKHGLRLTPEEDMFIDLDLSVISRIAGLRDLALGCCSFNPSPGAAPLSLPPLRRLALTYLGQDQAETLVLASAHLPQLTSLAIIVNTPSPLEETRKTALESALLRFTPQLTFFAFSFYAPSVTFQLSDALWSSMSVLQSLVVDHTYELQPALEHTPANLRHLTIQPPFGEHHTLSLAFVRDALQARPKCLQSLGSLSIPPATQPPCPACHIVSQDELESQPAQIAELCESLGATLILKPRYEYYSCPESVEHLLSDW